MQTEEHRETVLRCPYDPVHLIRKYKFQVHLRKCRKAYPHVKKLDCPFDATHVIDEPEYEHHLATCPSSGNIRNALYVCEPKRVVGVVPIEEACANEPVYLDEDWNAEHASYNPLAETENRDITRVLIGATKSERKAFKKAERERMAALEKVGVAHTTITAQKETNHDIPLRRPHGLPKALNDSLHFNKDEAPLRPPKGMSKAQSLSNSLAVSTNNTINESLISQFNKSISICDGEQKENTSMNGVKNKLNVSKLNGAMATGMDDSFLTFKKPTKPAPTKEKVHKEANSLKEEVNENTPISRENSRNTNSFKSVEGKAWRSPSTSCSDGNNSDDTNSSCESTEGTPRVMQQVLRPCAGRGMTIFYNNPTILKMQQQRAKQESNGASTKDYSKYGYEE